MFNNKAEFSNKIFIITGAGGFLGQTLCKHELLNSATLILLDQKTEALDRLKNAFDPSSKLDFRYYVCDFENIAERGKIFSQIANEFPVIHGVVNCAALVGDSNLTGWSEDFHNQSIETWRRALEVNLTSIFELIQHVEPSLANADSSSIVNISSIYSEKGPSWELYAGTPLGNPAAYGVSKAGVNQLTRWLAATLAPRIRVNAIAAGGINRGQQRNFIEKYLRRVPLQRMANEHDIVNAILFFLSDMSSYITGEILHVDGGRYIC
jgi:NAD(P)-dependent dehydrogenase (short-subunit alcohol dehydrogenase family)